MEIELSQPEASDESGSAPSLSGSANQIEWALRIRKRVNAEFDRVAATFRAVAAGRDDQVKAEVEAIVAILEDKRAEVMRREEAGYFIHDWQEITDQVRQMVFRDERYPAIRKRQETRRMNPNLLAVEGKD